MNYYKNNEYKFFPKLTKKIFSIKYYTISKKDYVSNGIYDTAGHPTSMKAGNSLTRTEGWNKTKGLLENYNWGISGKSANTLSWNTRGNITVQVKNGISYSYEYDRKDQLTEEKKGGSKLNTWTYDAAGNRKTEAKGSGSAKTVTCYTKSDLVKSDGTWNYNYDANGNMTAKGKTATAKTNGGLFEGWTFNATSGEVWNYEYDLCNRLVKVKHSTAGTNNLAQVAECKYDFRDLMVCRTTGNGSSAVSEYFAYDTEGKLIYTEKGTEKHEYVYANGKIWCEVVTKGTSKNTYYHHTDHLGTTVCITNSSGSVVWQCEKDAFGTVKEKTNTSFTPNFTGKLLDANTGLYYFNARWYAPDMGRFITEDPARDGRNWFVYCRNNPLVNLDPTGQINISKVIDITYKIVQGYMTFDTGTKLGGSHRKNNNSLYQQQYVSQTEDRHNSSKVLGTTSSFFKKTPIIGLGLVGMSIYMESSESSEILVTNPISFIEGAENEIQRLNGAIDCFQNNPNNNDLISFLEDQKALLNYEIKENKEYTKGLVFMNNGSKNIKKEDITSPLPGIDYMKAYENSKKDENKKDE